MSLKQVTAKRLKAYTLFSPRTIETVAQVAAKQSEYGTYQEYFKAVGVPEPRIHIGPKRRGVPVVDVAARQPEKGILVIHLPMANPLDPNQLFQIATIADSNPAYRIIGFGNPTARPYYYRNQNLGLRDKIAIARAKHPDSLVKAEADYLQQQGIAKVHHVGYSFGAHKALVAASAAAPGSVESLVLVDPVAHSRGVRQLVDDFQRTFNDLGRYVDRTEQPLFFKAREDSSLQGWKYAQYVRPINIAIGFMLARLDFIPFLKKVLSIHRAVPVTLAWGTKSELGNDAHLSTSLAEIASVATLRFKEDSHAFANDVYLHAAVVTEALQ